MQLPHVHLCVIQPVGHVHALGLLDPARFFRHQFERMGASVSLAKNRLRHDAVNFVFGAHLGFDERLRERYSCVFVNLEQLGDGGAAVSPDYLRLLAGSAVVDYHPDNVGVYQQRRDDVPLISFAHAPYLADASAAPDAPTSAEPPIDVLFIGSMNARRRELIERIEASGRQVSLLQSALYGPERDQLIRRARVVLNLHFYPTARFEQVRVFQCLSLGTPVISERSVGTAVPAQFEHSVHWVEPDQLAAFFAEHYDRPDFHARSAAQLAHFAEHDVIGEYAEVLAFAAGYRSEHARQMAAARPGPWLPQQLHIGSGKDYRSGWLNVDILPGAQPDALLDLGRPITLPLRFDTPQTGPTELHAASLALIYANNVLEHVPDLACLMTNCLELLAPGGEMLIEVPYEHAPTAWQDPTHVRALNENSWIYYTDWFWYLGWFAWRFAVLESSYLDARLQRCAREQAHFMRIRLIKQATTLTERMTARTMQADGGGLYDPPPRAELLMPLPPTAAAAAQATARPEPHEPAPYSGQWQVERLALD